MASVCTLTNDSLAGTIILKIAYGYDAKPEHDPFIEKVDFAMSQFADILNPGKYLVDFLPWLRYIPEWLPGGGWKKTMRYYRETLDAMSEEPFQLVKDRLVSGLRDKVRVCTDVFWLESRNCCSVLRI